MVHPHPVVRRTGGERLRGQQFPQYCVVAVDESIHGDLGMTRLPPQLLNPVHRPIEEPGRHLRLSRRQLDPRCLVVAHAIGHPVPDRGPIPAEDKPPVGLPVISRLDQRIPDLRQRAVREPDHPDVVIRDQPKNRPGIRNLRSTKRHPLRQPTLASHNS